MNVSKYARRGMKCGAAILLGALIAGCAGGYVEGDGGAVYGDVWGPDVYVFGGPHWGHSHEFAHRGSVSRGAAGFHGRGGFHR